MIAGRGNALVKWVGGLWMLALLGISTQVLMQIVHYGPAAWELSQVRPWGVPVAAFVFWIGLAHAGTFFSAILLLGRASWRDELAQPAERVTLAAWCAAVVYPLLHMGDPRFAAAMLPWGDSRGIGITLTSPLIWDLSAIAAYGLVSLGFYGLERSSHKDHHHFKRLRALAWILLFLVVSVHTLVALDFATVRREDWALPWMPWYFLTGALASGIAAMLLRSAFVPISNLALRGLCRWQLATLILLGAFWLMHGQHGYPLSADIWITGLVVPQLLWWKKMGEIPVVRAMVACAILWALLHERMHLLGLSWPFAGAMEYGWLVLGLTVFFVIQIGLSLQARKQTAVETSRPYRNYVVLIAVILAVAMGMWLCLVVQTPLIRALPAIIPLALAAAALIILLEGSVWKPIAWLIAVVAFLGGGLGAMYLPDWPTAWNQRPRATAVGPQWNAVPDPDWLKIKGRTTPALYEGYCLVCHGPTGFEKMPMRKHYPYALKPTSSRWDAMGTDSLVQVILDGRGFMNAYRGRLDSSEARMLALWMRARIEEREQKGGVP